VNSTFGSRGENTIGKSAGEIWAADKKRLQRLKELTGFEVLVVWERDWMNNKEAEKERLRAVVLELSSQNQE
jgi:G:T-mismatch repair DNA endonuclease (very short patch repair protein)